MKGFYLLRRQQREQVTVKRKISEGQKRLTQVREPRETTEKGMKREHRKEN